MSVEHKSHKIKKIIFFNSLVRVRKSKNWLKNKNNLIKYHCYSQHDHNFQCITDCASQKYKNYFSHTLRDVHNTSMGGFSFRLCSTFCEKARKKELNDIRCWCNKFTNKITTRTKIFTHACLHSFNDCPINLSAYYKLI
jgi:hypothetical protein